MSVISVQIQLPSFSHSFNVSVSSASTVLDFKHEIYRNCVGSPNTAGQRVIYKGRVLNDTEIVGQVWKAADEPHTCHLAVHPSAWTAAPPNTTPPTPAPVVQPPAAAAASPTFRANVGAGPPQIQPLLHATYSYIQFMHINALRILARQPPFAWPETLGDLDGSRAFAKRGVESTGRGWPTYLNQAFPNIIPYQAADEGVRYTSINIDNLPYMSLLTPDATPTPIQAQAIRVLSYTFPLLCIFPPSQVQHSNPLQVNAVPPRPLAPFGVPMRGAFPQFPIRPLIIPLILLTIRTTLLLYFFQPARKPLFGIMVLIWVAWEVMGAVRGALGGENANANGPNNRAEAPGNGNVPPAAARAGPGAEARPDPGNGNNVARPAAPTSQESVLSRLAHINIAAEAPFAEPNSTLNPNALAPTLLHKIKVFFALLFLTLHPAVWDRRRTALRAREGRVREEARTREARALQREREREEREENRRRGADGTGTGDVVGDPAADVAEPPPPLPKPSWVAEYVQRVRSGDWVDE